MGIQLQVHDARGETKIVTICDNLNQIRNMTVMDVKQKIMKVLGINDDFRIVYRTETLEESSLLMSYGIQHMSTIHLILILPGGH
ncbi:hypothetical protein E3U43_007834 [Xyrichtys novacula]|uniref:Ubiquitin-like domain-containing protein n=1 Tax=Xyrichtys novacula TaxID=13765 RepID=A0AAV1HJE0_XYRNO|nr:hypothetical protein E3U43_007834 [Xyrichtys novacula]